MDIHDELKSYICNRKFLSVCLSVCSLFFMHGHSFEQIWHVCYTLRMVMGGRGPSIHAYQFPPEPN